MCRLSYFLFRIACQRDNNEGRCVGIAHIILNDDRRAVAVLFRAGTCVSELDVVNVSAPELPVLLQMFAEIVDRICDNAAEYDVEVRQDSETFFVWMILVPVLGYLVAMYRAIQDTNRLAEAYERSRQKRTEVHDNPNTKPPPPCMRGRLSGLTGSLAGRSFELIPGRSVELGRNPAEVSLIVRGEKISRIHCTVQYNGKDLGFNVTDHSRNGVFVNGVRIPYNVPTYVSGKSIVALADGANKFQLIEAADEDDRSPALGADNEE